MDPHPQVTAKCFICSLNMRIQTSVWVFLFFFQKRFGCTHIHFRGNLRDVRRRFLESLPRQEVRGVRQRKCHLSGLEEPGRSIPEGLLPPGGEKWSVFLHRRGSKPSAALNAF